ncbi:MAG: hypothetical protein K2N22_01260, partial [Clostridia bacterium]|nr:hypothetical protein [Clostridia bacterium]
MPTDTNAIGNLYKGDGKFSRVNLDKLAAKVSDFSNVDDMISAAKEGTVKTSSDFGNTVVNFGSYSFNGVTRELSWMPVYLSKSGNDAILTLWLANTAADNGTFSNQEISTFSDGSYSRNYNKTYNSAVVYSNSYDSSYIRNYVLNGSEDYAKVWNEGVAITPPALDTMGKFTQLVSGELSDYIVEPCNVNWQMSENKMKNDPNCNAVGNYPNAWTNDKLWLPSMYEVFDSALPANGIPSSWTEDGGLWKTGNSSNRQKRSNSMHTWLRSGYPSTDYYYVYDLISSGNTGGGCVNNAYAVRPALHLNLTSANQNATVDAPKDITGLTYDGNSKWITNLGTAKPAWLDLDVYNNTAYMSVKSISYEDTAGNAAKSVSTSNISLVNAGKYTVTMTIADGLNWTDSASNTSKDRTFTITIGKKESSVTPVYAAAPTYVPDELPAISLKSGGTAGTIAWDSGQTPKVGEHSYGWTFKPTDTNNYTVVTDSKKFNFAAREVEKVTIKSFNPVDDEGQTVTVYTNTTSTTLMSYMTVEVK